MNALMPYPGLKKTLQYLVIQARESMPYIHKYIPDNINNPEDLFNYLRTQITYKSDPKGEEYITTVKTLFNKNKGRGDCDDFTVLALASLSWFGYNPRIVLVGYNKVFPKHIYTAYYVNGKRFVFDLTNPWFDYERPNGPKGKPYKFRQELKVNL